MFQSRLLNGFAGPQLADVIRMGIVSKITLPGTHTEDELTKALDGALVDAKRLAAKERSHALFSLELIPGDRYGDDIVRVDGLLHRIQAIRVDWVIDQDGNFQTLKSSDLPKPGRFMLTLGYTQAVTGRKGKLRMYTKNYNLDVDV